MAECPKCHYTRTPEDNHVPGGVCPACGIAYGKYAAAQQSATVQSESNRTISDEKAEIDYVRDKPLKEQIVSLLFDVPEQTDPLVFHSRVIGYVVFFLWGWWFISTNGSWIDIGDSFMHNINLVFHEAGHILFIPFGRFMMILGGSLFQILLPLIIMVAFLKQQDNFEASIMLWWCGQNFIDISPYIADGEYRSLPLLAGMGEESHDWGNLLTMMDMVDKAYYLGRTSFITGSVIIVISLAWGAYVLWQQRRFILPR